jgi:DnaJ-class molecular chaperone
MTNDETTDALAWLEALYAYVPTPEEKAAEEARAAASKAAMGATMKRVDAVLSAKSPNACPKCNGSGYVGYRRAGGICFRCDGTGFKIAR